MAPKINPNDYSIKDDSQITLERIQKAAESAYSVFPAQITKSEIMKNGIVAVLAQAKLGKNQIKMEFYAKKKDNQILFKLNHNMKIDKYLNVADPRKVPPEESDIALFLRFWDNLLQNLGLTGRTDIGTLQSSPVPIENSNSNINESSQDSTNISEPPQAPQSFQTPKLFQSSQAPLSAQPNISAKPPMMEESKNREDEGGWDSDIEDKKINLLDPLSNSDSPKDEQFFNQTPSFKSEKSVFSKPNAPIEKRNESIDIIDEKYNPFLIDQMEANEYYWKLSKTDRVTAPSMIKTLQINLAVEGFIEEESKDIPESLFSYQGTGKFGSDKLTILIVVGEKNEFVYVRFISRALKLKDLSNPDVRKMRTDKNQSAFFVKLCDNVCKDLKIPIRQDVGGIGIPGAMIQNVDQKSQKVQEDVVNRYKAIIKEDKWIRIHLNEIDGNQEKIQANFGFIREAVEKNTRWPMKNLDTVRFTLDKYFSPFVFTYVDLLDIKSTQVFPILITYAVITPKPIAREIICSYKGNWSTSDNDDVSQKICLRMNNEHPSLDNQIQDLMKNEYLYHYLDNEMVIENKKTLKIKVEQTIHEPIKVRTIQTFNNKMISILYFSYFLTPESQGYKGFRNLSEILEIFDNAMNGLSKFYVISEEEQKNIEQQQIEEKVKEDSQKLKKCSKCGWMLSPGKYICPMCKFDNNYLSKSAALQNDDGFSASSALIGSKSEAKANVLLGSITSSLNQLDDELIKARELFLASFKKMVQEDESAQVFLKNISYDSSSIQQEHETMLLSLKQDLDFDLNPFQLIQIDTNELNMSRALVVLSTIKPEITDYHIPVVSYLLEVPAVPNKIILSKDLRFISSGEDWGFCKKLNTTSDFMDFMKDIYGGNQNQYTKIFHAKKKDLIGRVVPVEGLDFELSWLIALRPYIRGGDPDHYVLTLHHFILSEAENYGKMVPLSKTLVAADAIITGIDMVKPKENIEEEPIRRPIEVLEPQKSIFADINQEFDAAMTQTPDLEEMNSVFGDIKEESIDLEAFKESMKDGAETVTIPNVQEPMFNASELTPEIRMTTSIPAPTTLAAIPADLMNQLKAFDISPVINRDQIQQKLTELGFQVQSMLEMKENLRTAHEVKQITIEQYMEQDAQIFTYLEQIEAQQRALKDLMKYR